MTNPNADLPTFLRELVEDEPDLDVRALERLPELVAPIRMPQDGLARLLAAVEELPLRYAPLFARLAALWDLPEDEVIAVLQRAQSPVAWRKIPLLGVRVVPVRGGPRTARAETFLVRFDAGMRFPRHRHPGPERILVLEGSYRDDSGAVVRAGDLHEMPPGSAHEFRISPDGPCVGAVVQHGREFTGAVLRWIAKFLAP